MWCSLKKTKQNNMSEHHTNQRGAYLQKLPFDIDFTDKPVA